MKTTGKVMSTVFMGVMLTGCGLFEGSIPNDLEDNWPEYMVEAGDNLESYMTDIDLTAETDSMGQSMTNRASFVASIIGDFERGHVVVTNEQDGIEVATEVYFEGSNYYINEENGWQEIAGQETGATDTSYQNVLNAIIESEEFITADRAEDDLILTYQGYDQEVWDAFEAPFSLTIDGFQEEDIEMMLEVTVDAETQLVEDLELSVHAENEIGTVSLLVEVEYDDHNEIEELEVEDEVNEATSI